MAVALAMSSVPITATATILLSQKASRSALWFLMGWLLGLYGITAAFSFGIDAVPFAASAGRQQPVLGIAEITIGLALVAYMSES